jgi:small subunit ribosomal protein S14
VAKTSMVERERRRAKIVKRYANQRAQLKELIRSPRTSPDERVAAQVKLQKMPRDASASRQRNRCAITGRSRGVYRKFGLARTKIREVAFRGEIPGLSKASW